jgi:cellulase/cellobiase CelA1
VVNNDWGNGFVADVSFTNNTGAALSNWQVTWVFAGNQQITNLWNGVLQQTGQSISVRNASWNGSVSNGGTAAFGFQASYSGANAAPTGFRLNGVLCSRQ